MKLPLKNPYECNHSNRGAIPRHAGDTYNAGCMIVCLDCGIWAWGLLHSVGNEHQL